MLYGDVLIDAPLDGLISTHRDSGAAATIAVFASTETEGKGLVELSPDGSVRSFVEKGERTTGLTAWVNAGIYVLEHSLVQEMTTAGRAADFGPRLVGHVLPDPVTDVGTPGVCSLPGDGRENKGKDQIAPGERGSECRPVGVQDAWVQIHDLGASQ